MVDGRCWSLMVPNPPPCGTLEDPGQCARPSLPTFMESNLKHAPAAYLASREHNAGPPLLQLVNLSTRMNHMVMCDAALRASISYFHVISEALLSSHQTSRQRPVQVVQVCASIQQEAPHRSEYILKCNKQLTQHGVR